MKTIDCAETDRFLAGTTALAGAVCATLLVACGGSDEATVVAMTRSESPAATSIRSVQFEGCVVDQYYVPRTGSRVRVLSADGRLVGDATSGQQGVFMLRVPARETLSIGLVDAGDRPLVIATGSVDVTVGACLQHRRD